MCQAGHKEKLKNLVSSQKTEDHKQIYETMCRNLRLLSEMRKMGD